MPTRNSKPKGRSSSASRPLHTSPSIITKPNSTHSVVSAAGAHISSVLEVHSPDGDFSATLWMPEADMLSASLSASQLVAVSVCRSSTSGSLDDVQLEPLGRLCSRQFGSAIKDYLEDEPGSFSVIASAWPCRKLKGGVRLSKQLAHALGCPQLGTQICMSIITFSGLDQVKRSKSSGWASIQVTLQECQELEIRWCPFEIGNDSGNALEPLVAVKAKHEHKLFHAKGPGESTPLVSKQFASRTEAENLWKDGLGQFKSQSAMSTILASESNRSTVLLERFASCVLHCRYMLKGNFVSIPVCGQTCMFQVVDAKSFSELGTRISNQRMPLEIVEGGPDVGAPIAFLVGSKTHIKLTAPVIESADSKHTQIDAFATSDKRDQEVVEHAGTVLGRPDYSAIGGLSEQIATLKEIIEFSLLQPDLLRRLGLQRPHGVLLYGPPGTGKTSLALASSVEAGVKLFSVNGPEVVSEYYGESESALRAVFVEAQNAAPSVVFIDELDAIAPQRTEGSEELGQRIVATLLMLMDGGGQDLDHVLVIAATNRLESIDPALRRPGRFDREIEIGVPSPSGRCEILHTLLKGMSHTLTATEIEMLAAATHGFVGADLTALCNEAAMVALRRFVHKSISMQGTSIGLQISSNQCGNAKAISNQLSDLTCQLQGLDLEGATCVEKDVNEGDFEVTSRELLKVVMEDFEEVKARVRPSAMREVMLEVPKVHWSDIGGQEHVKQQLQESVEWPQKHGDAFSRIGIHPPRGVLLYGPPGCSKTLMARAVATEAGLNFIAVKGPELFSKWVGESEKAVHSVFERARAAAPSVVFFDELDGLAVTRDSTSEGVSVGDRVMSQLLVEMDGFNARKGVTVIAATNRPDKIDAALLRPGRFDRLLYVSPPDEAARVKIFEIHTKKMPCGVDVDNDNLAARTDGYTGADIASICREAAIAALEEDLNAQNVMMRHFNFALSIVQPSLSGLSESFYSQFNRGIPS